MLERVPRHEGISLAGPGDSPSLCVPTAGSDLSRGYKLVTNIHEYLRNYVLLYSEWGN